MHRTGIKIRLKVVIYGKLGGTVEALNFLFEHPVQVFVYKNRRKPRNN